MIKLNRTTEYALMALRLMARKGARKDRVCSEFTSAREVADLYGLPFEITAKTLQRMKDTGLIQSAQGARGGYILQRPLEEITLAEFLELMEGPQGVVACAGHSPAVSHADVERESGSCGCEYQPKCEIKSLMSDLNSKMRAFLSGIRLADLKDSDVAGISARVAHLAEEP